MHLSVFGSMVGQASGEAPAVPVNTVAPALSELAPVVGATLAVSETWLNADSLAWLWYRDGVSLDVTTESHTVTEADIGGVLKRSTIATNAAGSSAEVFSDETSAILSNDTSLSAFTIEGQTATDGGTLNLDNGYIDAQIGELVVVATPTHGGATVGPISLDPSLLAEGDNVPGLIFEVSAEDGSAPQLYNVTLHVLTFGLSEIVAVDFTGLSGADFVTAGAGKYFQIYWGADNNLKSIWLNTGTESNPGAGGDFGVDISILDDGVAIAEAVVAQLNFFSATTDVSSDGPVLTFAQTAVGPRTDPSPGTSGADVTVTQQGMNAV